MAQVLMGGSSSPIDASAKLTVVREYPRRIREIEHLWVPLSDGCRLAARLWLPEDAERNPAPAILEYLPYRKRDFTAARDDLTHRYIAGHGYACLRVDLRGSGDSDGLLWDEYLKQEQDDAVELIAWIARQSWCTGAVGMIGISWGGFNGLQVAARRPPALKAIVTVCSTDDRYADDVHFIGGALLQNNLTWGATMFAYMTRSPDPAVVGERWRDMWLERLRNLPLFPELWLRHPRRDEFWKHGSVCENYADIACAVYAVGGWTDGYPNAIPRLLAGLPGPRKGLIGPWGHRLPHFATPGPQIGFLQETLRWWDTWLKGVETGVMSEPLLRAWMQESVRPASWYAERPGRWVGEDTWPSASIENLVFFLTGAGLEHSPAAESRIALCSPETVGMLAGMWSVHGITPDEASDQREEDGKSLTFDSAVLEAGIEILGAAVLEIDLASDKPVAKLVVRLCDVSQDGASLRVSYGILNLTHRDSHAAPSALEPGRRYRIRIRMKETAHAFPRGHRIRVALSTTYWPMTWPTPERATLTIFAGGSWIGLPERKPRAQDSSLTPFGAAESAAPAAATVLAPGRFERTITRDLGAGVTTAILFDDYGVSRLEATGLEIASTRRYEFSIGEDDPLSARAEVRWTIEIGRGDWRTRSAIRIVQTATREAFLLRAQMEAFEGERSVMSRNSDCDVPRDLV